MPQPGRVQVHEGQGGSILAVLWSRNSGHSYGERMFRRYRAELAECLAQLDTGG